MLKNDMYFLEEKVGVNYKPFITANKLNSQGTASVIRDWKTGRSVHCLSQGEMLLFYILRWDDNNLDIREQFPLNYNDTVSIALEMGFNKPRSIMTTDMLVTSINGNYTAYSVKADKNLTLRQLELLCIEKQYWMNQGVGYKLIFKNDMNRILASNIRLVTEFYDVDSVFDQFSAVKHKIAIKEILLDMKHDIINNNTVRRLLEGVHE